MEKIDIDQTKMLAHQLKTICDENGCETDPHKSAEIFHKLAQIYSKITSDKISLIKSVGLLNAALVRKPHNKAEIEKDLFQICHQILRQANVRDQTADLIEQGRYVKSQIDSMRERTKRALNQRNKTAQTSFQNTSSLKVKFQRQHRIMSVREIQFQVTEQYKEIMRNVCHYCVNVLGPPPCKFAVAGMGSLARTEITPYSDFEHVILLEIHANYEQHLEYFRWLSVIFHVIILNVQETIIPSLNIKHLNDKSSEMGDWFYDSNVRGVSFDGMMAHACKFPLGRTQPTKNKPWTTELIKPVDEMLKYLSSDVSLKNGYHLSDILMETCFVYGDPNLHVQFENGIDEHVKSKTVDQRHIEIKTQVEEDLDKYAIRHILINLRPKHILNVKQLFYRTSTLFIAALGKLLGAQSKSNFDIIDELAEQRKISDYAKQHLSFAVAISCELRLSVYMNENSQHDNISSGVDLETMFEKILTIIDKESLISYFQITYCLQLQLIKKLAITSAYNYSNPKFLNLTICNTLRLDEKMLVLLENYIMLSSSTSTSISRLKRKEKADYNEMCHYFDETLAPLKDNFAQCASKHISKVEVPRTIEHFSVLLNNLGVTTIVDYAELGKYFLQVVYYSEVFPKSVSSKWYDLNVYLSRLATSKLDKCVDQNIIFFLFSIYYYLRKFRKRFPLKVINFLIEGLSLLGSQNFHEAMGNFQLGLGIMFSLSFEKSNTSMSFDPNYKTLFLICVGSSLKLIAICSYFLNQKEELLVSLRTAVSFFQEAAEIFTAYGITNESEIFLNAFTAVMIDTACCFHDKIKSKNDKTWRKTFTKNLSIYDGLTSAAVLFCDLGMFYKKQNRFEGASALLQICFILFGDFEMFQRLSANTHDDCQELPLTKKLIRAQLLTCYMEIYQRERVENHLKDLHKCRRILSLVTRVDSQYLTYAVQI